MKKIVSWLIVGIMAVFWAGCAQSTEEISNGEKIDVIQEKEETQEKVKNETPIKDKTGQEKNTTPTDNEVSTDSNEEEIQEPVPKPLEGEIFTFGSYYGEAIEWIVIDSKDDKALLWSRYCIDAHQFHDDSGADATWETCSLRQWINTEFMQNAFSMTEQTHIAATILDNIDCGQTEDKLFILSAKDIEDYPETSLYLIGCPTVYAANRGLFVNSGELVPELAGKSQYWIRGHQTDGMGFYADWIDSKGEIRHNMETNNESVGVRVAFWYSFEPEDSEQETVDNSEYIIKESSDRYLTAEDLNGLSKEQLRLARNEIYARHGYQFNSEDLNQYFSSKSWYYPKDLELEVVEASMNIYEKQNLQLIVSVEEGNDISEMGDAGNTQYGYPELDEYTLSLFEGDMDMTRFNYLLGEWDCGDGSGDKITITENAFNGRPFRVLKLEYVWGISSYQIALAVYFEDDIRIVQLTTGRNPTRAWENNFTIQWFDRFGDPEKKDGYVVEDGRNYYKDPETAIIW